MASVIGSVDLSKYVLAGRYNLPEPTRTTPPPHGLLAQEASAITYNSDTDTLFVVGDGGTSIVQISKTGELIDSMTLAQGNSPQGTEFYDPEGLAYIGAGVFVMVEERDRQAVRFSYAAGTTLSRAATKTVKLGTTIGNVGLEGLSYDPSTSGYIFVKEIDPEGVFQTSIDFDAGTASNGSATTANSVNLFDPALAGLLDFADVFALSNLAFLSGSPLYNNLLILSQEESKIVNISRSGVISNWLQLQSAPTVSIPLPEQQTEGLTMDSQGNLYVVSENGGGDFDHPQLWVYTQSSATNQAPSALALTNQVTQILENSNTSSRQRVADIKITDDELGNNSLALQGADSSFFEIFANALYLKAGVSLDYETKTTYSVTVTVDDPTVGSTPDLTANFSLAVLDVANEIPPLPALFVSEVAPWSSGNSPFNSDWFELTNASPTPVTITGWKMDDNSNSFGLAAPLSGITTLAAGESVVFMEIGASDNSANKKAAFLSTWFGANPPVNLQVGTYTAGGVGLSTGGDAVNIYNSTGVLQANITFGASPAGPFPTFNNAAGLTNASVTTMSAVGVNGAFQAPGDSNNVEIGSPGSIGKLFISEVAPWSSGNSPVAADWFELTNTTSRSIDLSGWKMDDSSGSYAAAVALSGISAIAPGESVIFIETPNLASAKAAFLSTWFGASAPANLQIGSYSGSGVGLSTGGDAVNLYDASGVVRASVSFGGATTSAPFLSFNNAAGASSVSLLSSAGVAGAFVARNDSNEVGSPGGIGNLPTTFNFSASSYSSTEGTVNNGLTPATVRVLRQGDLSGTASVQLAMSGGMAQGAAAAPAEGTSTGPSSSATPYVLPISGSGVSTKSLLTVGDAVNGYAMVGIPDGLGAFDNGDGTFTLLMNQELGSGSGAVRAHGAKGAFVSSWVINKADLSVVSGADLIQNVYGWNSTSQSSNSSPNNGANGNAIALNRFCSADLPAASAFYNASSGLGSQARIFMNGEEGGSNGYPIATIATGTGKGNAYVLGKFNLSTNGSGLTGVGGWENLLANPYAQDKTIVIGNNDGGSGLMSGALAVYVGTKTNAGTDVDKAGLTNGSLKFVTVAGNSVEITNTTTRSTGISSGTRFTLSGTASTTFSRPEDGAWDPKDPSKYYFVTTDRLDQVTDGIGSQIGNSRLWRLSFDDITNPEAGGSVDLLIDGDIVGGQKVNMFDNMSINQFGQVLLQEDVGGAQHNGKIWQYDIATDSLKVIAQHDVARFGTIGVAATSPYTNDEESSGIIDMQDILGAGWSLFVDQAHYPNANPDLVEGGQLLALFNPDTYKAYGPDLIGTTQTINFAAGEAFKDVSLQVFGDTLLEGVETANLILQNPSAGSMVGTTQPAAQLQIQDPTTFNFSASSYSSTEGTVNNGLTPATVRVLRQGDLSGTASVQLAMSGGMAQGAAAAPAEGTSTGPSSSATPYVLPISGSGVSTKSLLTVGDAVNGYAMVGIPDGLGAFDNGDGTFTLLMNQELGSGSGAVRAHGAKGAFVSSWVINKADLSVVSGADLIQNVYGWNSTSQSSNSSPNNGANGNAIALNRFCSADLPAASAFYNASSGLGSQARIFMNGEEGGSNGYPIATIATGTGKGNAYVLGKFNLSTNGSGLTGVGGWENLLANPYAQDKTIVIGNNDGGSGLMSGALAVYVGTKTNAGTDVDKAGLTNGSLKFVTVAGNSVEITNTTTRSTGISSGTRFTLSGTASTTFSRPEDGAWDPKDPSKYYFVTTDRLDQVTDGIGSQIGNSRLWRLSFDDITNPEAGGSVDLLIDGDIVGGQKVNMFDNMSINQFGQVLLQEDVGGAQHNGKIWQYDIATDSLKVIAQHDVARFGTIGVAATSPYTNDEESSGIIDMQDILGAGWSLFVDQAHYPNANPDLVEGGQLLALFNPDTYKAYGPDLIGTTQTINFAAGEAFKDVSLQVFGDTLLEGVETANLILQNPSAGSMVGTTQPAAQLQIQDVNPIPTALNLTQTSINENVSANSVVGLLTATLPISGDTCVFTLASGSGDQDNSSFQIVGNQLKLLVSPNFEAKASYSIRIKATEQGGNALDSVFSIAINDLNEIASISGTATASVKEGTNASNAGLLTASGTLTVNDPDAAQSKFDTNVVAANGNLGTLIITESGAYSYSVANALPAVQALAAGQSRQDTFTVKSLDGTASQDIVVTIQGASAGFNGVAAGDATTNRATLWTRSFDTADSTKRTGLSESVTLQLATDSSFGAPVFTTTGSTSNASHDYTLKLDATGLIADTTYYYRFQAQAGELSQVGTFKTAPLATNNRTVRFGHSGDVDGVMRPYLAMQDLGQQKLDFFLFDGDTIYETGSSGSPAAPTTPATEANPTPANVQALRDGYYRKYLENLLPAPNGTYSGLRDFFAAQGNYTTLDNHELGNKECINGGAPLSLRTHNFNGSTDTADDVNTTSQYINDSVSFETLLGAYLDYQPIRTPETLSTPSDGRTDGELKLYGSQQWGGNVLMISLDDRSFRDVRLNKIVNGARLDDTGSRADNPGRTMLGATQLAWLKQELLAAKANSTAWTFINMSSPIDQIGLVGSGLDGGKSWIGGYRAERNDLLKFIADNKITNVAFLACDDHQGRINELTYMPNPASDPFSPASYKTLPGVLSIVDGPMGATGPDTVTNHSPSNIKALADAVAQAQINAGLNPIGLDKNFPGLFDVKREGDPSALNDPKPVDFFTPDTFNYAVLEVTKEGILNVALRGVDSYASNSFPAPAPGNQPREILSFSIDGLQAQRPYRFTPQSQAVYEGDQLTIKVTAENAASAAGKPFFWKFSGPGVTPADFKENSLTGKGSTGNDGTYSLTRTLAADLPIEGEEALKVTFYQDGAFTKPLAPAISIRVLEPNTTGPSDTRDLLTGTPLDDTLSGVPNGSTLRGLGTVDTLIGNAGNDLFRLGDAAGRFYDDLNNTTPGTADFAYIKDFTAGDRIQLTGKPSDYILGTALFDGVVGNVIYARNPNRLPFERPVGNDEWIGFVKSTDNSHLSLSNANQFAYVG